jgi:hypothetical protein
MFLPMWPLSDVKIIERGNCCFLLLLMLLYMSSQCAYVFRLFGRVLSCVVLHALFSNEKF